jgi:hypothetical protein
VNRSPVARLSGSNHHSTTSANSPARSAHALRPHELVRPLFELARHDGRAQEHAGQDRQEDEGDQRQQPLIEEAARERLRQPDAAVLVRRNERRVALRLEASFQARVRERVVHLPSGEEQDRAEHQQADRQDQDLAPMLAPGEPDHLVAPPSIARSGPGSAPASGWPR